MARGPKVSTQCAARAFCAAVHLDEVCLSQERECYIFFIIVILFLQDFNVA